MNQKYYKKHVSCKCECNSDGRRGNSNQKWNNDKCRYECKNPKEYNLCKKDYIWNPATCSYGNAKNLGSNIENLVITCDEIIETTKSTSTKCT